MEVRKISTMATEDKLTTNTVIAVTDNQKDLVKFFAPSINECLLNIYFL